MRRRSALTLTWFCAIVVLLVLCFHLYGHGYGLERGGLIDSVLDTGKHKASAPDADNDNADSAARTQAEIAATDMPTAIKPSGASAAEPAVVLRQGTYVGTTLLASPRFPKSIEAFRGVPYAQDTGGENRFRPPQPLSESRETFEAVSWGKICPNNGGVVQRNMSENCLNANIYRPAGLVDRHGYEKTKDGKRSKKRPRLPVIVYIHGGGFNTGHGIERNMASFAAWAKAPMVAINFNYRVGPLGFLPSDVAARAGLLNLGLRDQQMLLEWVQENIEAFGGDPKKVTIVGLSAGAHSIGHHIMYYSRSSTKAPFVKAILESGATTARAVLYPTHPRHLVQFREFLVAAGAAGVPEADVFSHLRRLPLETIVRAAKVVWDKYVNSVTWPFQPVIDGPNPFANSSHTPHTRPSLIPDLPIKSWHSRSHLRIPIITGYNTNEGTVFIPPRANTAAEFRAFFQGLIPSLTQSDLDKLESLYPDPVSHPSSSPYVNVPRGMGKQWARLDAAYSHYAYICPVLQTAHHMSASGVADVYVYRYAATAAFGSANHGDEAPVVAHDMEELGNGRDGLREVADAMHGKWARFVSSALNTPNNEDGDEDGDGKGVQWPAFVSPLAAEGQKKGSGKIMVFGEGNDERGGGENKGVPAKVVEMTEREKEACRFWWERVWLSQGLGKRAGVVKAEARL
ncbi:alpha/beta-hydrolase [Parathielavia appendiculata]|uniref:Carboxylic ester hydrolase n=1 Tax=Parathielavia appendiculata TaxID=2587402 RepID=A0AAN6TXK6_9PEZI|nr:alpha/beta-hydrolase [Parathielavia appendiculata]